MMTAQGCASALQGQRMQEEGAGFYVCVYVYAPTFGCNAYADGVCVCTQLYLKCEVYRIDAVGQMPSSTFFCSAATSYPEVLAYLRAVPEAVV